MYLAIINDFIQQYCAEHFRCIFVFGHCFVNWPSLPGIISFIAAAIDEYYSVFPFADY